MIEQLQALATAMTLLAESNNNLAAAMEAGGTTTDTNNVKDTTSPIVEYDEPILWIDNKTGEYGSCANSKEWVAVKGKSTTVVKVPESKYNRFIAEQEEKPATKPKTTRTASKTKAAKKPDPKAEEASDDTPNIDIPEVDEEGLIKAFKGFMSSDLDKDERDERIAFVKPMLQRFGVNKATELEAKDRGIAVRLLQLKEAGHDIDPEAAGWDPLKIIAECEAADDDDLV